MGNIAPAGNRVSTWVGLIMGSTHISFYKSLYIFSPTTYNLEVKAWRFFNVQ